MRILMATQFFLPVVGGEERVVDTLSRQLIARGHDVAVVTTTPSVPGADAQTPARVHRIATLVGRAGALHSEPGRRHLPPAPDPEAVVRLRRVIRTERPDVVHAHNWLVHSVAAAVAGSSIPLVLTLHDHGLLCATKRLLHRGDACAGPGLRCLGCSVEHYGAAKGSVTALALRPATALTLRRVDVCLPVSSFVARAARLGDLGVPHEVIPNFVDAHDERPDDVRGLPSGPFIAFAGDLTYDKGVRDAVDAVLGLPDGPPLVLVGRRFAREPLPADPRLVVLGPRSHAEVMEVFRRSAVVLVPSVWPEPFGLVAAEALALGRPTIVTALGALPEIVQHDVSGLVVPGRDPAALRTAVARVLHDPPLAARLGAAAVERARAFTPDAVVPRLEGVYRRVIAERRGDPGPRRSARGDVAT
ncbi:MAG TPA: glycosyltransferase family 4 protein [Miltoncostaeaceae bacterium]|nr:glycosyltransferase family 4 protein [Miltoncostaeaceae bacterium]